LQNHAVLTIKYQWNSDLNHNYITLWTDFCKFIFVMEKIVIRYDCPKGKLLKLDSDGNMDCSSCNAKVYNFTKNSKEEFIKEIKSIHANQSCGKYRLDQVCGESKLNWKNRLNIFHDRLLNRQRLRFVALLVGVIIISLGCKKRHITGKPAPPESNYSNTVK
jgi:hypothetical protein